MRTVTELREALHACEQPPPPLAQFLRNIPSLATAEQSRDEDADAGEAVDVDAGVRALEAMLADADPVDEPASLEIAASTVTRRPGRRRCAIAAVATVAVLGGGMSAAAAAGVSIIPRSVLAFFGADPTPGAFNPIPSTARVLFTTDSPDGVPMQLWYSDATDHGYCTYLLEPQRNLTAGSVPPPFAPRSQTLPANAPSYQLGGGCSGVVGDSNWKTFGRAQTTSTAGDGPTTFIAHVPGAATVTLKLDDGTSRKLPIAEDWTAGWLTVAQSSHHPILIGYNAAGTEIGHSKIVS